MQRSHEETPDEIVQEMEADLVLREGRVRDAFEAVDCFLAPSRFLREAFVAFGLEADRIIHNPLGVEVEKYRRETRRRFPGRPLKVGFLGSVQPVKGVHVLLEALCQLPEGGFEAWIYGDMTSKPEYVRGLLGQLGASVRLMGRAAADEVPALLRSFDVLVVPSVWWENSPLVILEAFASGLPVVVSNIGGMAELVKDGLDGLHFEVGDPRSLALALLRLGEETGLLERLSENARRPRSIDDDARFHDMLFNAVLSEPGELEGEGDF